MESRTRKEVPRKKGKRKAGPEGRGAPRILFVDDDEGCRSLVSDVLAGQGLDVVSEATVDGGLRRAAEEEFEL